MPAGTVAATTLIQIMRYNLTEPVTDLTNGALGTDWTNSELLVYLNEAVDELWDLIRTDREDYFQTSTTLSLTTSVKEYALIAGFRQLVGIKATTSGYESIMFKASSQSDREFQERDALPANSTQTDLEVILYDLIGTSTLKLADFPPVALSVTYDYISSIAKFTLSASSFVDINDEMQRYLEAVATRRSLLKKPGDLRIAVWDNEIKRLAPLVLKSVSKRNIRESQYVEPYNPG